jgi:hypothetical protein
MRGGRRDEAAERVQVTGTVCLCASKYVVRARGLLRRVASWVPATHRIHGVLSGLLRRCRKQGMCFLICNLSMHNAK